MKNDVQFEEAGSVYTVADEAPYTSELVTTTMRLCGIASEEKTRRMIILFCVLMLCASSILLYAFSGFFTHRVVANTRAIDYMKQTAPFRKA